MTALYPPLTLHVRSILLKPLGHNTLALRESGEQHPGTLSSGRAWRAMDQIAMPTAESLPEETKEKV